MISTEIVGLLGIIRDLVSRKTELDKTYFENFIQPAWGAFVDIHKIYKESFSEYAKLITNDKTQISSLLNTIRRDYFFTSDLRSELSMLLKNIPSTHFKTRKEYLVRFVESIIDYFDYRECMNAAYAKSHLGSDGELDRIDGVERIASKRKLLIDLAESVQAFGYTYYLLSRKGTETNNEEVNKILERAFMHLQSRFEKVAESYYALKKDLLT